MIRIGLVLMLVMASATARADVSPAERMRELRLEARSDRHTYGVWLFAWGAASTVAGGLMIGLGQGDGAWVGAGAAAASFGVVNALLAFGLLDLSGDERHHALAVPASDPEALERLREAHLVEELETGQFYAINFGLDFAYTTAGVFMYVLGRKLTPEAPWLQGAGLSVVSQAAFLFAFDLLSWLAANRRAEAFRIAF